MVPYTGQEGVREVRYGEHDPMGRSAVSPYRLKPDAPAVAVVAIGLIGVILFGIYAEPILQFVSDIPTAAGVIPR